MRQANRFLDTPEPAEPFILIGDDLTPVDIPREAKTLWGSSAWRLIRRYKLPIHWDGTEIAEEPACKP